MRRSLQQGFTLLELLVVVSIIALALSVVAVNFGSSSSSADSRKFSRELVALLRYSRDSAVAKSQVVWLKIVADPNRIVLFPAQRELKIPAPLSLELSGEKAPNSMHKDGIYFYPDGSSNGALINISTGAEQLPIAVNWLTGEVNLGE